MRLLKNILLTFVLVLITATAFGFGDLRETVTDILKTGYAQIEQFLDVKEGVEPASPSAGYRRIFANEGKFYQKDSTGKVEPIGSGDGGGDFLNLDKTQAYKYAHNKSSAEKVVGTWFGCNLYEKSYSSTYGANGVYKTLDETIKYGEVTLRNNWNKTNSTFSKSLFSWTTSDYAFLVVNSTGVQIRKYGAHHIEANFTIQYTKNSDTGGCN